MEYIDTLKQKAPYIGGNDALRALHDLDILDKHQALIATIAVVSLPWPVDVIGESKKFATTVAKDGQRLVVMPKPLCPLPPGTIIDADISILLNAGALKNTYVVKQLAACIGSVEAILNLFKWIAEKTNSPSGVRDA